jgi:hypothetical protein
MFSNEDSKEIPTLILGQNGENNNKGSVKMTLFFVF